MKCVCVCACVCSGCTPCCISVYQGGLWSIVQVCLCGDLRFVLTWLWEGSQEVPRILRNPKLHYRAYKRPSPVPILSQLYPVHANTSHFLKIHLNIILPFTPGSPKWVSFPQVSPPKPCIRLSSHSYALHAPPISLFSILSPEQYWVSSTDH